MDPVGRQKKIQSNEENVGHQKLVDGGGASDDYGQDRTPTGTWKSKMNESTEVRKDWRGKVSEGKRKGDQYAD